MWLLQVLARFVHRTLMNWLVMARGTILDDARFPRFFCLCGWYARRFEFVICFGVPSTRKRVDFSKMHHVLVVQEKSEKIKRLLPLAGNVVEVTWSDGMSELKDLSPLLMNHRMFSRVRSEQALFASVKVVGDGSRIEWLDGSSLSSKAIARIPRTTMDAIEFRSIMADLNFTSEALGCLIGLSRRAITSYRAGEPIPKAVALAMHYLHQQLTV